MFKLTIPGRLSRVAAIMGTDRKTIKNYVKEYDSYNIRSYEPPTTGGDYSVISENIIKGLLAQTKSWHITQDSTRIQEALFDKTTLTEKQASREDILSLPEKLQPQMTENFMSFSDWLQSFGVPSEPSGLFLAEKWNQFKETGDVTYYHSFRIGLDILDYDPIMYAMIDTNPNSMSHWLPQIAAGNRVDSFFRIPETRIIRVPMTLLQLTRKEEMDDLTVGTLDILNRYCKEAFLLDQEQDYFAKTGTYAQKPGFQNIFIPGNKTNKLGEQLLNAHMQANRMASIWVLNCIYGASTTTEWVVREFVSGMEEQSSKSTSQVKHQVFIDFDTKSVRGTKNQEIAAHLEILAKNTENLTGKWLLDILQNENDFWLVDMVMEGSDIHKKGNRESWMPCNPSIEDWMPKNFFPQKGGIK